MTSNLTFETGAFGRKAVAVGPWTDEATNVLLDMGIVDLELNSAKGWSGDTVTFLEELPKLASLRILDYRINSVQPVHFLTKLRSLEILTYCKTEVDFSFFPLLEDCSLEWRPRASSLFNCKTLRHLFLNRYNRKETRPFGNLSNLNSLTILAAPIENLSGLASLTKLITLRLGRLTKLRSLEGLEDLTTLEELEINTCRGIGSIKEIARLKNLVSLSISNDGEISSLSPLHDLEKLQKVIFYESTNITDGDLSLLTRLKYLEMVSFRNRRHYSHKREDISRQLTTAA